MQLATVRTEQGTIQCRHEYRGRSPIQGLVTLLKQALAEGSVLVDGRPAVGLLHLATLTQDVMVLPDQPKGSRQSLPLLKGGHQTMTSAEQSTPSCTNCSQNDSILKDGSFARRALRSRRKGKHGS